MNRWCRLAVQQRLSFGGKTAALLTSLPRLLQRSKRPVFGLVLGLGILFLLKYTLQTSSQNVGLGRPPKTFTPIYKTRFKLRERKVASNITRCLHTNQGKYQIADSDGAICQRNDLNPDGCCSRKGKPMSGTCDTCLEALQCCKSYEHCVSCCFNEKIAPAAGGGRGEQRAAARSAADPPRLALNGSDHERPGLRAQKFRQFGMCAERCRVTSKMILHGNQYRHPFTHCYWEGTEPKLPTAVTKPKAHLSKPGADCASTCSSIGHVCHEDFFEDVNSCEAANEHFNCDDCKTSKNPSAPSLLIDPSSMSSNRGRCIISDRPQHFDCEGFSDNAIRLCVCVEKGEVYR